MEPLHRARIRMSYCLTLPAGLMALALTTPSQAQMTDAQKAAIKSSVRSDDISNCTSASPGGKEAPQCLQTHMA